MIDRVPVTSSNIVSIGFEKGPPAVLEIEFRGGGIYQYRAEDDKIVESHFNQLKLAESKGKHFTAHIRKDPALKVTKIT